MNLKWFAFLGAITLVMGFVLSEPFYLFIKGLLPEGIRFVATNPSDGFLILMWCGLSITLTFFLLGSIIIFWLNYRDAFYKKEKELIKCSLLPAVVLFSLGNLFGIFLYTKIMLPFFIETNLFLGLDNLWNLNNVVVSGIGLSLVLGFCFLFPIVLRGLIKIGFVDKVFLKSKRGFVVVGLLLVSGLVTPTPDVLSQLVVALPLYILFELSLL